MEHKPQNNDEVDVFELFGYIGRGFNKLGNTLLRFFNFLLRNIVVLIILVIVGIVAGYFVDKSAPNLLKTETFIVSNFGSAEYVYESINGMEAIFKSSKEDFLQEMGVTKAEAKHISLEIAPVISVHEITEQEQVFLELLQDNKSLSREEKQAVINKNYSYHKITLFHPKDVNAEKLTEKIISHLRQNDHYMKVFKNSREILQRQIKSNLFILAQIDSLFKNYSKNIGNVGAVGENLVYSNSTNLGDLLETRMDLQTKTNELIIKNVGNSTFLKVLNIGNSSALKSTGLFSKKIVIFPLLLIGLFFLIHVFIGINKKAAKLK